MRGDVEELYRRYHKRLLQVTAYRCRTSEDNVEDACATAWAILARRDDVRRQTAFAWLKEVARNEAMRLDRQAREFVPLEASAHGRDSDAWQLRSGNEYVTPEALGEALDRLRELPERHQRVVALRAFGWKYTEMADELDMTYTRVNRLLTQADHRLQELREDDVPNRSQRAARLQDLERDPPAYIKTAIGHPPSRKSRGYARRLQEWRRVVATIEAHRERLGVTDPDHPLGPPPPGTEERSAHRTVRRQIERFVSERGAPDRGR